MTTENIVQEIRQALEGRPGQPIVLGVCNAVAGRFGWEVWCVRLAVIIFAVVWTGFTLVAYVVAGFMLKETEARTRGFFSGLAIIAREWMDKLNEGICRIFGSSRSDYRGY
jgi:phage shock protein PspC (stress-responsive transcriptional regulator)